MTTVKKTGQGTIFNNKLLEVFTRTNPVVHVITYGGSTAWFLFQSQDGPVNLVLFAFIGLVVWTLTEYLMHRFLFHINESKFQYMIHGVHHEYPRDKERLMMPPVPGLIILSIFTVFFYLFFGAHTFSFMAGFTLGYIGYTFIHYIVHAWKPIPGIKFLWAHHHKHHNPVYEDKAYGVSSPFWDYVFGTMPPKSKQ